MNGVRGREEKLRMTSAQALFAKELREKLLREKSDMGRNEIKMALKKGWNELNVQKKIAYEEKSHAMNMELLRSLE